MPVVAKLLTSQDIIHGLASVNSGKSTPTYDPLPPYSVHYASGDSLTLFQVLDKRFKYHGGTAGSGNWEH
jgi:hypothetical protein